MSEPTPEQYSRLISTMQAAQKNGLTVHLATRATCQEHIEEGDDTHPGALTAAAYGISVELLAEALAIEARQQDRAAGKQSGYSNNYFTGQAERVADEYARLAQEVVHEH
jgi:hypothetical protein